MVQASSPRGPGEAPAARVPPGAAALRPALSCCLGPPMLLGTWPGRGSRRAGAGCGAMMLGAGPRMACWSSAVMSAARCCAASLRFTRTVGAAALGCPSLAIGVESAQQCIGPNEGYSLKWGIIWQWGSRPFRRGESMLIQFPGWTGSPLAFGPPADHRPGRHQARLGPHSEVRIPASTTHPSSPGGGPAGLRSRVRGRGRVEEGNMASVATRRSRRGARSTARRAAMTRGGPVAAGGPGQV